MTQKQQFISKFLRNVYKFDEVGFESDGSGCMRAVGYFQVYHPLSGKTRIRVPVDIWMDKTKKGMYSIKFKTWGNHIPMNKANEYVDRAQLYWPGAAKIEVYRRYAGCSFRKEGGAPTLRIWTNIRPWVNKKKETWVDTFEEWLKVHGALKSFLANLKRYRDIDMEAYAKTTFVSGAIAGAFHWAVTDEGDMYWRRLSGEWEVYVQENYSYFQELQ